MTGADVALARLRRCVALALIALVNSSWPLWTGEGDFPQIPWVAALADAPPQLDALLMALLLGAAAAALLGPSAPTWTSRIAALLAISLGGLVTLDQHRLQPWAYEFLLLSSVLACGIGRRTMRYLRAIVISIYVWSGVSKVDPGFVEGHGQMLLDGLLRAVRLDDALWSDAARTTVAAAMPAAELLIALLLSLSWTRTAGLASSILLHAMLLLILGPRGLDHERGVLLWNLYFIAQNLVLFRPSAEQAGEQVEKPPVWSAAAAVVTSAAILLPLLNPLGCWDHWPSWSVYSAHPAVVRVFVRDADVGRLPASLHPLVDPPPPLSDWRRVRLDQWSFAERGAPPYPQARWKLAVAAAVASNAGLGDGMRVTMLRRANWWGTAREERQAEGVKQVLALTEDSWLNVARPR